MNINKRDISIFILMLSNMWFWMILSCLLYLQFDSTPYLLLSLLGGTSFFFPLLFEEDYLGYIDNLSVPEKHNQKGDNNE